MMDVITKFDVDREFLREFEENLNPAKPEKSKVGIKILGYGEISTVFEIPKYPEIAFKRIPMFRSVEQVERYVDLFYEYNKLLTEAGLKVPRSGAEYVVTRDGRIVLFLMQEKLDSERICNNIVKRVGREEAIEVFSKVLDEMYKIEDFNREKRGEGLEIGLDGQMSNWAMYDEMLYFDTSTPMVRRDGVDLLDTDIFLRACPPGIRILLKKFFLQDILDRYYNLRMIVLDLIANLFKEGRDDLINPFIDYANDYLKAKGYEFEPMTFKEIEKYYKEDAFIWSLYLNLRKIHRFVVTKIMLRRYEFILPGKIKR